jgi:hypothetical protein
MLFETQAKTWAGRNLLPTIFYFGSKDGKRGIEYDTKNNVTVFYSDCSDEWNLMHLKFKLLLDYIKKEDIKFDYIFRSNASSYIDPLELQRFAKQLPKDLCYCGIDGGGFASGAGVFLSPDIIDILRESYNEAPHNAEDVLMGEILSKHGISITPGAKRCDYWYSGYRAGHYHYRCKSNNEDRNKDVLAMQTIDSIIRK